MEKKPRVDVKDKFKKKEKILKKRKKKEEENIELYYVHWYLWSNLMWEEILLRLSSLRDKLSIK